MKKHKDSNCTNWITESCNQICPGCEITDISPIKGNIFTDAQGKKYRIFHGQIPTKLEDQFIWLKKPNKGVHTIAPLEWFRGQSVDTAGMYPLELIKTEKFIASVVALVQD